MVTRVVFCVRRGGRSGTAASMLARRSAGRAADGRGGSHGPAQRGGGSARCVRGLVALRGLPAAPQAAQRRPPAPSPTRAAWRGRGGAPDVASAPQRRGKKRRVAGGRDGKGRRQWGFSRLLRGGAAGPRPLRLFPGPEQAPAASRRPRPAGRRRGPDGGVERESGLREALAGGGGPSLPLPPRGVGAPSASGRRGGSRPRRAGRPAAPREARGARLRPGTRPSAARAAAGEPVAEGLPAPEASVWLFRPPLAVGGSLFSMLGKRVV